MISALSCGRLLDYYYRKEEARVGGDYRKKPDEFRIESVRLRIVLPFAGYVVVVLVQPLIFSMVLSEDDLFKTFHLLYDCVGMVPRSESAIGCDFGRLLLRRRRNRSHEYS